MRRCRGGSTAGATGRWTRAEEQPSGARCLPAPFSLSLSPCPSPSLFLCLTGTRSKSLEREISCEKSSTCRVNSCPFAFAADARSIPSGLVILALSPHEFASGVCGKALGVRRTPFLAYSMPNRVRRTPYCRRSW